MCINVSAFNDKSMIGSATCSTINGTIWYFNRLFVFPNFRKKFYGSMLLDELLSIVKEKNIILQLDINPYGEMTYEQLEDFYIRHGFVKRMINDKIFGEYYTYFYNAFIN